MHEGPKMVSPVSIASALPPLTDSVVVFRFFALSVAKAKTLYFTFPKTIAIRLYAPTAMLTHVYYHKMPLLGNVSVATLLLMGSLTWQVYFVSKYLLNSPSRSPSGSAGILQ